jgi:hypothetical protein
MICCDTVNKCRMVLANNCSAGHRCCRRCAAQYLVSTRCHSHKATHSTQPLRILTPFFTEIFADGIHVPHPALALVQSALFRRLRRVAGPEAGAALLRPRARPAAHDAGPPAAPRGVDRIVHWAVPGVPGNVLPRRRLYGAADRHVLHLREPVAGPELRAEESALELGPKMVSRENRWGLRLAPLPALRSRNREEWRVRQHALQPLRQHIHVGFVPEHQEVLRAPRAAVQQAGLRCKRGASACSRQRCVQHQA